MKKAKTESIDSVIEQTKVDCQERIKERLGLESLPEISLTTREFNLLEDGYTYVLPQSIAVTEPAERYTEEPLDDPVGRFKLSYLQLHYDADKNVPFESIIIEALVKIGKVTISAGCNWIIFGKQRSGETFGAILGLNVRPFCRNCRISSLLKLSEIQLGQEKQLDFIQTWHSHENQHFIPAILPGLRNGAILFHGNNAGGEVYEEEGYVHLRTYFDGKPRYSMVCIEGDKDQPPVVLKSPDQNDKIIEHLLKAKRQKFPGKIIKEISELKTE